MRESVLVEHSDGDAMPPRRREQLPIPHPVHVPLTLNAAAPTPCLVLTLAQPHLFGDVVLVSVVIPRQVLPKSV